MWAIPDDDKDTPSYVSIMLYYIYVKEPSNDVLVWGSMLRDNEARPVIPLTATASHDLFTKLKQIYRVSLRGRVVLWARRIYP